MITAVGEKSAMSLWVIVVTLAVPAIIVAVMLGPHALRTVRDKGILASGTDAPARVVEIIDTNTRVNRKPQVLIKLEVQPAGGAPFPAEAVAVISPVDMHKVHPGTMVNVRYDPSDPSRVVYVPE